MKRSLTVLLLAFLAVMFIAVPVAISFPAVDVYKKTSPSVVLIVASSKGGGSSLVGAGSVITSDGLVITNAHVVVDDKTRKPFRSISVYTRPDEITGDFQNDLRHKHKVKVLDYDRDLDLALLRVDGLGSSSGIIRLADPREIMVGEEVVAIGHPEQGGLWSLTYGRISGQLANQGKVKGKNVYQTDTSVNRGNSGGPLLDKRGYMVGVNTNIARKGSGNLAITGVNFALKSSVVSRWIKKKQGIVVAYGSKSLSGEALASAEPATEVAPTKPSQMVAKEPPVESKVMDEPKSQMVSDVKDSAPVDEPVKVPEMKDPGDKPMKSDTILTPPKPYKAEDLYEAVAKEMEDMMLDMKDKFRKKRR